MAGEKKTDNIAQGGFPGMDPEKQKMLSARGGRAAHRKRTAHEFKRGTTEASEAGKKGGNSTAPGVKKRGFASMSPERRREIASQAGKARAEKGVGHKFTSDEAKEARKKGGSRKREPEQKH